MLLSDSPTKLVMELQLDQVSVIPIRSVQTEMEHLLVHVPMVSAFVAHVSSNTLLI